MTNSDYHRCSPSSFSPSYPSTIQGAPIHHNGSHFSPSSHVGQCRLIKCLTKTSPCITANHGPLSACQMTFQLPAPVSLYFGIGTHGASSHFHSYQHLIKTPCTSNMAICYRQPQLTNGQSNDHLSAPASVLRQWHRHFLCLCHFSPLSDGHLIGALTQNTMQCCQLWTISGQSNNHLSTPASVLRQWNNHLSNPTLHWCLTKHHIKLGCTLLPATAYQMTIE